jgi:hypothetical protein
MTCGFSPMVFISIQNREFTAYKEHRSTFALGEVPILHVTTSYKIKTLVKKQRKLNSEVIKKKIMGPI